jgi:predicted DCC family thiol-disulfide oxidoreductase YuxK
MARAAEDAVILFDGICVLCSRWYRFVTKRDADRRFRFVPIQSAEGRVLAARWRIDADNPDTFALITGDAAHARTDALLRVLSMLPGWRWTALLRAVPERWRDALYDLIARNRYRWFGRLDACLLPSAGAEPHQPTRPPPA